jgi:uncharacterized protein involved in response to NO
MNQEIARNPIPRLRSHSGSAVLGYGFRPFFLLAGLSALTGIGIWLVDLFGVLAVRSAFAPIVWHAHEMLFGFAVAAIAGFLLTAIPNWTGRLPLQGNPLLGLVLLWIAGRIAVACSQTIGAWPAAVIDVSFLVVLLFVVAREILAGKNWRNLMMAAALAALAVANALMHADVLDIADTSMVGWRLAIAVVTLLIALIGGRIVPSFTRNWLAKNGPGPLPEPFGIIDKLTLAATIAAFGGWIVSSGSVFAAGLAAVAAVLNLVRLYRWRGYRTIADPLVWVLHLGYAWIPLGLGLLAAAQATVLVSETAAIHAFTVGAIGTMTLAVMTRATLGHTARALRASPGTVAIYLFVSTSALARVAASAWPDAYAPLLWVAGTAWIVAFAGFVGIYGPMLVRPRVDGKAG